MKTWKLAPVEPEAPNWRGSTWTETVIIRADSEDRARQMANLAFGKAVERRSVADNTFHLPWGNPAWASCEPITSDEYPAEGPEAILSPDWADNE